MELVRLHRLARLAPASQGEPLSGIAATWNLVEADGFQLAPGCFRDDVARVSAGAALPLLWMHDRGQPPIGRVRSLVEADDGLRFSAPLNATPLARAVAIGVDEETARDVSVYVAAFEVDPARPHLVTRAALQEISICTTGFGADQGAGLGRALGLWDAADALAEMQALRSAMDRLSGLLSREYESGSPVSPELASGVAAEIAQLKKDFAKSLGSLVKG